MRYLRTMFTDDNPDKGTETYKLSYNSDFHNTFTDDNPDKGTETITISFILISFYKKFTDDNPDKGTETFRRESDYFK